MTVQDLQLVNDQLLGVWDIYIKFYTAFLTINLAALGFVVEKIKHHQSRKIVCVAFILQNVLSLGTAVGLALYTREVAQAFAQDIETSVLASVRPLGVWGGLANAGSHVLFIGCWLVVYMLKIHESDAKPATSV